MNTDTSTPTSFLVNYGTWALTVAFPEGASEADGQQAVLVRAALGMAHALETLHQAGRDEVEEQIQPALRGLQFILGMAVAIADAVEAEHPQPSMVAVGNDQEGVA